MPWHETTVAGKKGFGWRTPRMRVGIVTDCGPRIAFLGKPDGANLLFQDTEDRGRGDWRLMGGHRVRPTRPGADESEDAYRPDNAPCEVEIEDDVLTAVAPTDDLLRIRRGIRVTPLGDGSLSVENFITNAGDMLYSGGVWALTCTEPAQGRRYGIPLGDGSCWDCFRIVMFRSWGGGHTSRFDDPQIRFTEDMLLVDPQGIETKRMIEAPRGIIAMDAPDQDTTFLKKTAYDREARYPLGCNMAFYVGPDNFMVEMETLGPEVTLRPGETAHNVEQWLLTDRAIRLDHAETLTGLFDA